MTKGKLYKLMQALEHPNFTINPDVYKRPAMIMSSQMRILLDAAAKDLPHPRAVKYSGTSKAKYNAEDLELLRLYAAEMYQWEKRWFGEQP